MSHTPILVFCLRSRALLPLGGGNVAALQHEGRVGLVRPGRSFEAKERCSQSTSGQPPLVLKGLGGGEAKATARGSRGPAGQSALPLLRGGRPGVGKGPRPGTSRGGGPQREGWRPAGALEAAESGLPGTWRTSPRPGRGPGSAGRCGLNEALPQRGSDDRVGGKLVLGRLSSRVPLSTTP